MKIYALLILPLFFLGACSDDGKPRKSIAEGMATLMEGTGYQQGQSGVHHESSEKLFTQVTPQQFDNSLSAGYEDGRQWGLKVLRDNDFIVNEDHIAVEVPEYTSSSSPPLIRMKVCLHDDGADSLSLHAPDYATLQANLARLGDYSVDVGRMNSPINEISIGPMRDIEINARTGYPYTKVAFFCINITKAINRQTH